LNLNKQDAEDNAHTNHSLTLCNDGESKQGSQNANARHMTDEQGDCKDNAAGPDK
jgi:hypothetical protein